MKSPKESVDPVPEPELPASDSELDVISAPQWGRQPQHYLSQAAQLPADVPASLDTGRHLGKPWAWGLGAWEVPRYVPG